RLRIVAFDLVDRQIAVAVLESHRVLELEPLSRTKSGNGDNVGEMLIGVPVIVFIFAAGLRLSHDYQLEFCHFVLQEIVVEQMHAPKSLSQGSVWGCRTLSVYRNASSVYRSARRCL